MALNYIFQPEKPEKFGGEDHEDIDEFLATMNMYLRSIHVPAGTIAEVERYKVMILHKHLTGQAKDFWMELNPTKKVSYTLATNALRDRFPVPNHEILQWNSRVKAMAELNGLAQGSLTSDEYIKKANSLYATLGEEHAFTLATKFVEGINDRAVQAQVDYQTRGNYARFSDVMQAYIYSTATTQCLESTTKATRNKTVPTTPDYGQMMYHMGEMFRSLMTANPPREASDRVPVYLPTMPSHYIPIQNMPTQTRGEQSYGQYQPRPVVCFRCGGSGYRAYDCQPPEPLPREEQEWLRALHLRNPNNSTLNPPQVVAHIDEIETDSPDLANILAFEGESSLFGGSHGG